MSRETLQPKMLEEVRRISLVEGFGFPRHLLALFILDWPSIRRTWADRVPPALCRRAFRRGVRVSTLLREARLPRLVGLVHTPTPESGSDCPWTRASELSLWGEGFRSFGFRPRPVIKFYIQHTMDPKATLRIMKVRYTTFCVSRLRPSKEKLISSS